MHKNSPPCKTASSQEIICESEFFLCFLANSNFAYVMPKLKAPCFHDS
jgi:hypothetical protein